jgi:hypothetical protein
MAGLGSNIGFAHVIVTPAAVDVPWWGTFNPKVILGGTGNKTNAPSEWDLVRYGPNGTPLPGIARVRRCERKMKLYRKEHPGSDFEAQTFLGWSALEFDFDLDIWTAYHLAELETAIDIIFPGVGAPPVPYSPVQVTTVTSDYNFVNPTQNAATPGQSTSQIQTPANAVNSPPIPIQVSHPALQIHGVSYLVFQHMTGPIQKSESIPDIFKVSFKCVQFKPAQPSQSHTLAKPSQTLPTGVGQGIPAAQQPNQGPSRSGGAAPPNYVPAGIIPAGPLY